MYCNMMALLAFPTCQVMDNVQGLIPCLEQHFVPCREVVRLFHGFHLGWYVLHCGPNSYAMLHSVQFGEADVT